MNPAATAGPPLATEAAQSEAGPRITVLNPHFDYFSEIMPEPPVVCGMRLKPLSIGRYRMMARMKVAFVSEQSVTASAADLLMGVLICSSDCELFARFAAEPGFKKEIERWARKFGFFPYRYFTWTFLDKWVRKWTGDYFANEDAEYLTEQMRLFHDYIREGSPDMSKRFLENLSEGNFSGSHWSQNIEATLREHQGWTKKEIDEEPLPKALWDFYKHQESQGLGRFLSPEEQKQIETPLTPEKIKVATENAEKIREYLAALAKQREAANG